VVSGGELVASTLPEDIARAVNRFFDLPPAERRQRGATAAQHVRTNFSYQSRKQKIQACLEGV
jgi:glycosyltransferase involved in cell wall biosynthesis